MSQIRLTKTLLNKLLFFSVGLIGIIALIYMVFDLFKHFVLYNNQSLLLKVLSYMIVFLLTYDWAVSLPSGAKWKPSMVFVLFSMLTFPFSLSILVVFPGVLISAIKKKLMPWDFLTTIGHLAAGIFSGWFFLHRVIKPHLFNSNAALIAMCVALTAHFLLNRLISVVIITYRKNNSFSTNLKAVTRDINWTYLCIYSLGMVLSMVDQVYSYLGSIAAIVVIYSLYKSVSYYQKYRMVAENMLIDGLTQAENRAGWELFKDDIIQQKQVGTLVMMDLDDFKGVNDTFGHTKGDSVLIEFVERLKSRLPLNCRLFRYGGDEFLLFISHEEAQLTLVKNKIKDTVQFINRSWKNEGLPVSVSLGMTFIQEPNDLTEAIEEADSRMYKDKQGKKDRRIL